MASAEPGSSGASIRIGSAFGIPVRVHVTFLALVAWFAWTGTRRGDAVLLSVTFLLLVFGCVLLHELGHAMMARAFDVRTRDIVLYPFGGIARLENMPGGKAELLIALAGPAVNVVLAGVLFAVFILSPATFRLDPQLTHASGLLTRLLAANLALFVFNLVPAFPMDGGRVLRAALSLALSPDVATRIATRLGQVLAILFSVIGVAAANPFLVLISMFVFLGASQEALIHRQRAAVGGKTARQAMITRFAILRPQETLVEAARHLVAVQQQHFPVVDAWDRIAGVMTRPGLLEGLAEGGGGTAVLEVMERDVSTAVADTDLNAILDRLLQRPNRPIFVLDDGQLLGMLTLENVTEFIRTSRDAAAASPSRPGSQDLTR